MGWLFSFPLLNFLRLKMALLTLLHSMISGEELQIFLLHITILRPGENISLITATTWSDFLHCWSHISYFSAYHPVKNKSFLFHLYFSGFIPHSQLWPPPFNLLCKNHRIIKVEKNPLRSLSPTPAHPTVPPDHIPQCHISMVLQHPQG